MEKFERFKSEILRRAKNANACIVGYKEGELSTNFKELMRVIKRHFQFCVKHKVIDADMINEYPEFEENNIYINRDNVENGYLITTEPKTYHIYERGEVVAFNKSNVIAEGDIIIYAYDKSYVIAKGECIIKAHDESKITARDYCKVVCFNSSNCSAFNNVYITCYDSSSVGARDKSTIECFNRSTASAFNNSKVVADNYTQVYCADNASVIGKESCIINSYGENIIKLYNKSILNAFYTPQKVKAYDCSIIRCYSEDNIELYENSIMKVYEETDFK